MSAQLTTEQALQKIAQEYDSRIFFGRLEQHGIVPKNDAEAAELLKLVTFLEKQKQVEEQSELTQLISRADQRARRSNTEEMLVIAKQASGETLSPKLRMVFAIVVQGLAQTR